MITKQSRVRHIDPEQDKKYGIMEVWEIKNGNATCRYGDYANFTIATFPISELRLSDK